MVRAEEEGKGLGLCGGGRRMKEGGWRRRAGEEEGAQPRMKVTYRMVIDCKK